MNRKALSIALILFALILSGCATSTRYVSDVDSLARQDAIEKKRYILLPGNKDIEDGDLQFLEFASYVDRALADRGFVKTGSFQDADVAIFFTYAIGDPKNHQYTYSVPVYGETGVSSATTYGTVSSYGNTATYSGKTTYTPSYGIVGSSTHLGSYTTFSRFIVLDAYDVATYKEQSKMSQVWRTSVVSAGSSGDLRLVMPYMVAAMKPHVGTNTGRKIEVVLPANDPTVMQVRGTSQPSE